MDAKKFELVMNAFELNLKKLYLWFVKQLQISLEQGCVVKKLQHKILIFELWICTFFLKKIDKHLVLINLIENSNITLWENFNLKNTNNFIPTKQKKGMFGTTPLYVFHLRSTFFSQNGFSFMHSVRENRWNYEST